MTAQAETLGEAIKTLIEGFTLVETPTVERHNIYTQKLEQVMALRVLVMPSEVEVVKSDRESFIRRWRFWIVVQDKLSGTIAEQNARADTLLEIVEQIENQLYATDPSADYSFSEFNETLGSRQIVTTDNATQRSIFEQTIEATYISSSN